MSGRIFRLDEYYERIGSDGRKLIFFHDLIVFPQSSCFGFKKKIIFFSYFQLLKKIAKF